MLQNISIIEPNKTEFNNYEPIVDCKVELLSSKQIPPFIERIHRLRQNKTINETKEIVHQVLFNRWILPCEQYPTEYLRLKCCIETSNLSKP